MIRSLLIACALSMVFAVRADAGSSYDWQSGNIYNWNRIGGSTHVNGMNLNTGSQWNTTIQHNGNMNGFDSRGNSWNYNAATGAYMNSNGHGCVGHGYGRTCW